VTGEVNLVLGSVPRVGSSRQAGPYKLRAEIDERHAEEFFAVIEPRWSDGARRVALLDPPLSVGQAALGVGYTA
jgi:hypothetical protein